MPRPAARGREAAKHETREALIAAALEEFAEHGFDTPSLDAICARAGFTRGAFYVHFRTREDLMVAVVEHAMGAFIDAVIAQGDEAGDLERTVTRFADTIAVALGVAVPHPSAPLPVPASVPFARVLDAISRSPRLRAGFTATLGGATTRLADVARRGQRTGEMRDDIDPTQVAFLLTMVALGTMVALDVGTPMDPRAAAATVLALLKRG